MFGKCLLTGLGISIVSTGLYAVFTNDNTNKDKKNEYLCIFCIILLVSFMIVFITSGNSESIVLKGGSNIGTLNNKPPL